MSVEDITFDNSVKKPTIFRLIIYLIITFLFAQWATKTFYTALFMPEIISSWSNIEILIGWVIAIGYSFFTLTSNRIMKIIFKRLGSTKYLEFTYNVNKIFKFFILIFVISSITIFILAENIGLRFWFLSLSLLFLYTPFFILVPKTTTFGEIQIVFSSLLSSIDNFNERQKWLVKFSKILETKLRKGHIKILSHTFVGYCNMKLMQSEGIKNYLRDIKNWMIYEKNKIFDIVTKIVPTDEIKPIKRTSPVDLFLTLPSDVRKYLFLVIVGSILFVFKPDLMDKVIEAFIP